MSGTASSFDDIRALTDLACNGQLTNQDADRLGELLRGNDEAQHFYLSRVAIETWLWWEIGDQAKESASSPPLQPPPTESASTFSFPAIRAAFNYLSSDWPLAYVIATVIFGIGAILGTVTYVSQPEHVAHRSANPQPSISDSVPSATSVGRITGMVDCVFDKKGLGKKGLEIRDWGLEEGSRYKVQGSRSEGENSSLSSLPSPLVRVGDQIALASGLLEITYNAGAKVILQGPVAFKVDSADGGFLAKGKLTARVEKRGEGREERGEGGEGSRFKVQGSEEVAGGQWPVASDNHQSSILDQQSSINNQQSSIPQSLIPNPSLPTTHYPLFTIKTPTATVTDLGTEFGVEVDNQGAATFHVFDGIVDVRSMGDKDRPATTVRLTENKSVRVEHSNGGKLSAIRPIAINPASFVRVEQFHKQVAEPSETPFQRWLAHSSLIRKDPALVAYYTFDAPEGADPSVLRNLSSAGSVLDGRIEGAEWVHGRWPGKFALYFHGPGSRDKVVLPEPERFNFQQPFSVAVWFRLQKFRGDAVSALVAKGGKTWRLQRWGTTNSLSIDSTLNNPPVVLEPHTDVDDRSWHLVVALIDPQESRHIKQLYLDGRLEAQWDIPEPMETSDKPVWIGASDLVSDRVFEGQIDEAAVFARMLSADEIKAMYEAGNPVGIPAKKAHAR